MGREQLMRSVRYCRRREIDDTHVVSWWRKTIGTASVTTLAMCSRKRNVPHKLVIYEPFHALAGRRQSRPGHGPVLLAGRQSVGK